MGDGGKAYYFQSVNVVSAFYTVFVIKMLGQNTDECTKESVNLMLKM